MAVSSSPSPPLFPLLPLFAANEEDEEDEEDEEEDEEEEEEEEEEREVSYMFPPASSSPPKCTVPFPMTCRYASPMSVLCTAVESSVACRREEKRQRR